MFHFDDRPLIHVVLELGVVPVFIHLGVHHVLVDGGQLFGKQIVQFVNNLVVAFHECLLWVIKAFHCMPLFFAIRIGLPIIIGSWGKTWGRVAHFGRFVPLLWRGLWHCLWLRHARTATTKSISMFSSLRQR